MADVVQALEQAQAHHSAGRLNDAEAGYRQVLALAPSRPDAHYLLGVALSQMGRLDEALRHLREARRLQPQSAELSENVRTALAALHDHRALVLEAKGRPDEALAEYREALAAQPNFIPAHGNLGNLLKQQGRLDEAAACYQRILEIAPGIAQAHNDLGLIAQAQGKPDEAVARYRQALQLDANFAEACTNLGTALAQQKKYDEAEACCRRACALKPEYADAHFDLGTILAARQKFEEAAAALRQCLQLNPRHIGACFLLAQVREKQGDASAAATAYRETLLLDPGHLGALDRYGILAQSEGRLQEALACLDGVVQVHPNLAMAHFYRANICKLMSLQSAAIAGYRETVRLDPTSVAAWLNLAVAHNEMQQPDPAIESCERGLALDPHCAALCDSMAAALHLQGRAAEAIPWYRKAVSLDPDLTVAHSNLVYALNYVPGIEPAAAFAEHRAWAARHAEPLTAQAAPHTGDFSPERRLRIGYVSAHFRRHAVNYFTEPIIAAHDHERFEIFCYSDVRAPDEITARLKAAADQWRDVAYKSDAQLAQLVRDDRIDILVDLAGHIGGNRLLAFARKPAPIQVTYIGYQNTTGMSAMDYRLTDAWADPPGLTDGFYTEKLVRLPHSFFCYRPPDESPPITPLPARAAGHVTFGSFNTFNKVTPQALDAWMRILRRVDDAKLIVLAYTGPYVEQLLRELALRHDIAPNRVRLCGRRPIGPYLELIAEADIALDPFPFTGHTTTCDSIWMGVPVVMLAGQTYASRFGGSVLNNVGLQGLITRNVDEYVDKAVELASDLGALETLRAELRPRMAASPLLDFEGFTRHVEQAYRQMWRDWCVQQTADPSAAKGSPSGE